MEDRFIRPTEITLKTGLSLSTIWRLERDGVFPRRRSLGRKAVGWVKSEVDNWLQSREPVLNHSDDKEH
jgi:prophage regulatory protein